uniref:Reverse transcriptase domain-containing protein n=1 Tax=Tanacetum cinerariifolium TaxID=118510 RepID=A0A6L2J7I3_TANCI|nr:hypothetical protein [Tanacetum cinerariifolium]
MGCYTHHPPSTFFSQKKNMLKMRREGPNVKLELQGESQSSHVLKHTLASFDHSGNDQGKNKSKRSYEQTKQWMDNEISFPSVPGCQLVDSPIIHEALIEGTETKARLRESRTLLVGLSKEVNYPMGVINFIVTMGVPGLRKKYRRNLKMIWGLEISTVFGLHPYPFNYPTRRLTIEEMLAKILMKGGNMTSEVTRSKEINKTRINKNEPPRFEQDLQEKPHNDGEKNKSLIIHERTTQPSVKPQQSSIPFPNRVRKEKEEALQRNFLENLKQLDINIPFIEALVQIPKYAKYLKILLTNKLRLEEACMETMNESESHLLQVNELAELSDGTYENTRTYKERTKKWHNSRLHGDKDFKMYPKKLKSKWSGLSIVKTMFPHGAIEITDKDGVSFNVNGQRLKKYYRGDNNLKRMEHDIDHDSSCEQDDDLEDAQEDDEDVIQPLIPKTIHTTPPNEDYVAPATKSILEELLEEFGDEILNVTMVDEGFNFYLDKDIEEREKLLSNDLKPHYMDIQGSNNKGMEFEIYAFGISFPAAVTDSVPGQMKFHGLHESAASDVNVSSKTIAGNSVSTDLMS